MQSCNTFDIEPKIKTDYHNPKMPYTLLNNVRYKSNIINGRAIRIYINKGFRWNGSDIPVIFWRLIGSRYNPEYLPASCVHDFCCNNCTKYTNKEASIIFKDILVLYGVNRIKANIMAYCVYLWQKVVNKKWKKEKK